MCRGVPDFFLRCNVRGGALPNGEVRHFFVQLDREDEGGLIIYLITELIIEINIELNT